MTNQTPDTSQDELRKIVEDSVRHVRANVGFTLNNHEAAEQNIAMNVETIMAYIQANYLPRKDVVEAIETSDQFDTKIDGILTGTWVNLQQMSTKLGLDANGEGE